MQTPAHAPGDAWAKTSKLYTNDAEEATVGYGKKALKMLNLQPGEQFLDIATGPGALAIHAAEAYDVDVDAIDFSSAMVDILKVRLGGQPLRVRTAVMDGQALTFADDTFDAACSCFGIVLFPDYTRGLREMIRVLKSGGRGVVVSWGPPCMQPMAPLHEFFTDLHPELGMVLPQLVGLDNMQDEEGMKRELESAGFSNARAESFHLPFRVKSARDFVSMVETNPMTQRALAGAAMEEKELLRMFLGWMEAKFGTGPLEIPTLAVAGTACKP